MLQQEADHLKQQLEYRKRLTEKINEIHSAANLNDILLQIKDSIAGLFQAERITIYLVDTKTKSLFSHVKSGEEVKKIVVPISPASLAGYCAASKDVVNVQNAYDAHELSMINSQLHFDAEWDRKTGFRTTQVLCVPMKFNNIFIGVIQLINRKQGDRFSDEDISYATELATSLAIAIYNIHRLTAQGKETRKKSRYNYLLDNGIVSEATLKQAGEIAEKKDLPLDQVLMKDFSVTREDMAKALSLYYGTDFILFDPEILVPENLLRKIKPEALKKDRWVPLRVENGILYAAMEDPTDYQKQDLIRFIFPDFRRISYQGAFSEDISKFIDHFYQLEESDQTSTSTIKEILSKIDESEEPEVEEEIQKVSEQDSALVQLVNKIICDAYKAKASDIHIEPYPGKKDVMVRIRVDGRCLIYQKIPYKYKYALISRIKIMSGLDIAERRKPQDGKINFKKYGPIDMELRVATLPTAGQLEDVVLRILASGEPIPYDKLGLTERNSRVFEEAIRKPYGLVLVVGPTGSGKTTTLHSAISRINTPETKIWTAEDPVEITQQGLRQVQVNHKIGLTFASALRAFLRADPDVIMVGEMRDEETTSTGIEASLTGHLVFSTLHTNSAPETITRLLDMGMDPFSFSDALLCILAQRLARRLCSDCKEIYKPTPNELEQIIDEFGREDFLKQGIDPSGIELARAKGCPKCSGAGYKGRLGLHELLECTDPMKSLIKKKAEVADIGVQARADGMTTLKQDGILKVFQGLTDLTEVRRVCIK